MAIRSVIKIVSGPFIVLILIVTYRLKQVIPVRGISVRVNTSV